MKLRTWVDTSKTILVLGIISILLLGLFISCDDDPPEVEPEPEVEKVSAITITAKVGSKVVEGAVANDATVTVKLTTKNNEEDVTFYYTIDGSIPTSTSENRYTEPFTVKTQKEAGQIITVKVLARKAGLVDSTAEFSIVFRLAEGKVLNRTTGIVYNTIEEAIKVAGNDETFILGEGTHNLSEFRFPGGTFADNITIIGNVDAFLVSPRLDAQHYGLIGKNLTFQDINFIEKYFIVNSLDVKNLIIDNCSFTNGAYLQIGPVGERDGITIRDSIFEGVESKTSILIQSESKNIVLENNIITDAGYNGIQINKLAGDLKIHGNTIEGSENAAIRVATIEGAVLTITNNAMTETNTDGKYPGEVIRISGNVIDGTLTGNTYDGEGITFVNGIGKVEEED